MASYNQNQLETESVDELSYDLELSVDDKLKNSQVDGTEDNIKLVKLMDLNAVAETENEGECTRKSKQKDTE